MISVRTHPDKMPEDMELAEFERRVQHGDIGPKHRVCFPLVTGDKFVEASELEIFRGLYQADSLTFKRYFHLGRIPWLTSLVIALLCYTHLAWYTADGRGTEPLLEHGAKSLPLMLERGQWWRLVTANFVHVSNWHLVVNAIFLFNLGGPAEAIFRRLDYLLLLCAAAIGATGVSAILNPTVSCGASGMVFGIWGGLAVFGVRYRAMLPERYQRYFIGSVIPYSIFALYQGVVMPGIDNWSHLGGLLAGSSVALLMPPRLLKPRDPAAILKLLAMSLVAMVIAMGSWFPTGVGELATNRYFPRNGLVVPVPDTWHRLLEGRQPNKETYAFHNRAGPTVGFETRIENSPQELRTFVREFVHQDLANQLQTNRAQGLRIGEPIDATIAGHPAKRIHADIVTPTTKSQWDYYLVVRGYYRYVISFSAPMWLYASYKPVFEGIAESTRIIDPDILTTARTAQRTDSTARSEAELGRALALAGQTTEAWTVLRNAAMRWPKSGEPFATQARLLYEAGNSEADTCVLVRHALQHQEWTPDLLALAIDLHVGCDELPTAKRMLAAARKRFPEQDRFDAYSLAPPNNP